MTTPYEKKILAFGKRLENEDVNTVLSEMIIYMQGILDNEKDPLRQELMAGVMMSIIILKGLITVAKAVGKQNDETKSQLNSQLEKIIRLEKRLDDMVKGK